MDNESTNNNSINDNNQAIIKELTKFNWIAFLFAFLWAIYNKLWKYVLIILIIGFLPEKPINLNMITGIIFSIWFGMNANRLAWEKGKYQNLENFKQIQKKRNQNIAILILVISFIVILCLYIYETTKHLR